MEGRERGREHLGVLLGPLQLRGRPARLLRPAATSIPLLSLLPCLSCSCARTEQNPSLARSLFLFPLPPPSCACVFKAGGAPGAARPHHMWRKTPSPTRVTQDACLDVKHGADSRRHARLEGRGRGGAKGPCEHDVHGEGGRRAGRGGAPRRRSLVAPRVPPCAPIQRAAARAGRA
jgi:hypothetical protein